MVQRSTPSRTKSNSVAPAPAVVVATRNDPHELECLIQRRLQSHTGLKFSRLTVHKCAQGVCLEGLLEANEDGIDLCELVTEIAGVTAINRVVMRPAKPK